MKISIVIKVFSKTCYEDGDFIAIKIYYISSSNDPNYIIFGMRGIEQLYKFKDKWLDLFCRSERSVQRNLDPSYTIADSHWRDIKFYSFKGSLGFNTQNYDNTIECKRPKTVLVDVSPLALMRIGFVSNWGLRLKIVICVSNKVECVCCKNDLHI